MEHSHESAYKAGRKSAWLGIVSNILLFVVKLFAGIFGRSHAMIADAFHTASDAVTSTGVLIGFKIAQKPADEHHPFGHGRAESIVAKLISLVLILVGLGIAYVSAKTLISGVVGKPGNIALIVAVISIIVKELTYRRVFRTSEKIKSASLKADAYHHRSDALSSFVALGGIAAAKTGFPAMDPLAGIIVAGFIIKLGVEAFHVAYDELMDAAPPEEFIRRVEDIVRKVEGIYKVKKVMVRKTGIEFFLEITIGVEGSKSVTEGHNVTMEVQQIVLNSMSEVRDVIVHVEPA